MKLHHLHVAQRQPCVERHGQPVAALVAGRRVELVHRRAAAGREQHGARFDEQECAVVDVDHQHAGERAAIGGLDQLDGAMLFEPRDVARPDLLGQPVDDLDARQIALVDRAVERLSREGLLMDRAVRVAVEKAPELVFELAHALEGVRAQGPREVLVRQPLPALDRIPEMPLDRVARRERDVVAALHHPRTAAFAEQALDRDRDRQRGICLVRMQCREQARAAGAQDEDVGRDPADRHPI